MSKFEIFYEFIPMGQTVKVNAIDALTKIEVSIMGPISAGQAELKRTARAKLLFVLKKKEAQKQTPGSGSRGLIV